MVERNLLRSVTDATLELCCGDAILKDQLLSAVNYPRFPRITRTSNLSMLT